MSGNEYVLDFMFVYIFIVGEDSIIKGKAWDFINLFNPAYLKPGPGDPTAYVVVISCYYFDYLIWEVFVCFDDIVGIVYHYYKALYS